MCSWRMSQSGAGSGNVSQRHGHEDEICANYRAEATSKLLSGHFFTHGIHQPHEPPDEELVELVERAINGMN